MSPSGRACWLRQFASPSPACRCAAATRWGLPPIGPRSFRRASRHSRRKSSGLPHHLGQRRHAWLAYLAATHRRRHRVDDDRSAEAVVQPGDDLAMSARRVQDGNVLDAGTAERPLPPCSTARSAAARKPANSTPPTSRSNRAGRSGGTYDESGTEIATVAVTSGWANAYRMTAVAPIECPTTATRDGSTSGSPRRWVVATSKSRCSTVVETSLLAVPSGSGRVLAPCPEKSSSTTT